MTSRRPHPEGHVRNLLRRTGGAAPSFDGHESSAYPGGLCAQSHVAANPGPAQDRAQPDFHFFIRGMRNVEQQRTPQADAS